MGLLTSMCGPRCQEEQQPKGPRGSKILPVLKGVGTFREVIEKKGRFPGGKNHMNQYRNGNNISNIHRAFIMVQDTLPHV